MKRKYAFQLYAALKENIQLSFMRHKKKIYNLVICRTKRKYTIQLYAAQKENIQLCYMRHKKKKYN